MVEPAVPPIAQMGKPMTDKLGKGGLNLEEGSPTHFVFLLLMATNGAGRWKEGGYGRRGRTLCSRCLW